MKKEQLAEVNVGICIRDYETYLFCEERSKNTITKYIRDLKAFFDFLKKPVLTKESIMRWKEYLAETLAPASVNSMIAALNGFLEWYNLPQLKIKPMKLQKLLFSQPEKELSYEEYTKLVKTADKQKKHRLSLVLQTICATGIRVSELKFITVESLFCGKALVACKGKVRTVFLSRSLCKVLKQFVKREQIKSGVIFRTQKGLPLNRSNIWKDMKALCESAGVEPGKVFPHNLRHLFARTHYQMEKDIARLADILGHSCITTTRIYTMETGVEHAKQLDRMGLVLEEIDRTT